jgi:hypothetical protein
VQVLFPEPDLRRLRRLAAEEDRPVSEIIRRATEAWLDRCVAGRKPSETARVPTFDGGAVLARASSLRGIAWADRCAESGEPQ